MEVYASFSIDFRCPAAIELRDGKNSSSESSSSNWLRIASLRSVSSLSITIDERRLDNETRSQLYT